MNNKELLNRQLAIIIRLCTDILVKSENETDMENITTDDLKQIEEIRDTIAQLDRKTSIELPF